MIRTLLASAFLMISSAASAGSGIVVTSFSPPTARVSTGDVDLGSATGRTMVERRIKRAARQVCEDAEAERSNLQPSDEAKNCFRMAMTSGLIQLEDLASR